MKIFFSATSPFVRKCLVTAHELGLAGRIELLPSNAHPVQRDRSIIVSNPLGKVPTLITDDGQALYDSRVICEYLDTLANGKLFGQGAARWQALCLQSLGDGIMDAALLARYEDTVRPEALRWSDWRAGQLDKVWTSLAHLQAHPDLLGQGRVDIGSLSLACALWYLDLRFEQLGWRDHHEAVARWYAEFSGRASLQAEWSI
jgi:glutathione S-transferase